MIFVNFVTFLYQCSTFFLHDCKNLESKNVVYFLEKKGNPIQFYNWMNKDLYGEYKPRGIKNKNEIMFSTCCGVSSSNI